MKYTINKPTVWMYKTEDLCGEVSDELLFGTVVEIISENDTTAFCRTDYGYSGYLNKWELYKCENEDCDTNERIQVTERCDLLYEPIYEKVPFMSLPKGSSIRYIRKYNDRFGECIVGNRVVYIPNYAIERGIYTNVGQAIAEEAVKYIGTPYRWGGKTENGIDCSGLVFMCASLCGMALYRDSVPDERYVVKIPENKIMPGDIVYFPGHVAVMTDKTSFVHASASKGRVVTESFGESSLSYDEVLCYARAVKQRGTE